MNKQTVTITMPLVEFEELMKTDEKPKMAYEVICQDLPYTRAYGFNSRKAMPILFLDLPEAPPKFEAICVDGRVFLPVDAMDARDPFHTKGFM